MNFIDMKITIWNRIEFNDDANMQEVIKTIREVGLDAVCDDDLGFKECSTLYDTEERKSPKKMMATLRLRFTRPINLFGVMKQKFRKHELGLPVRANFFLCPQQQRKKQRKCCIPDDFRKLKDDTQNEMLNTIILILFKTQNRMV